MGRILLIGAHGQLGTDLRASLATSGLVALGHRELDVTDAAQVDRVLVDVRPAWVVNTAASHRVDDLEADPRPGFLVNAAAVHHLARAAGGVGARLLTFSTDYVFGGAGEGPYTEDSPPAPLNAYGVSKLAGELLVRNAGPRHVVIRTSGLYGVAGPSGKSSNFVEIMLRLAREGKAIRVVDDQVLAPTYTADLADAVRRFLRADPPGGLYHVASGGGCSWYEFARQIFAFCGIQANLAPTTSEAYGAPARRPRQSVLVGARWAALGLPPLRPWPEALRAYLAAQGHLPGAA
jgi:dTDP-4-dehydrorhamnose reductase